MKPLGSEGSLSQGLYTFDFSVLLYFANDQFSLLKYWFPVLCKLRMWHAFPWRGMSLLCAELLGWMLVQDMAVWFPVLESKHIAKCIPAEGGKKGINLVFGEKSRFTSGFSFFLSLRIFSSN